MHSYVSNVGFNRNPSKKAKFEEKPRFLYNLAFKETGSAPDIYWKLPYQRVRNLHCQLTSVRSNKATRSKFFSFYCSCFSVFLLFFLCLYFSYFAFCETQRKTSKMRANLEVIELFLFSSLRLT